MADKKYGAVRALIKADRANRGLSQSAYAAQVGINLPTLQRWEAGTAAPGGLMTAKLIASGISAVHLILAFEQDTEES